MNTDSIACVKYEVRYAMYDISKTKSVRLSIDNTESTFFIQGGVDGYLGTSCGNQYRFQFQYQETYVYDG